MGGRLREAVQKLAWQGLIHGQARVGLQIAEIRPEDHQYVMQVRRELESIAAALAATHAEPHQGEQLRECAGLMAESATCPAVLRPTRPSTRYWKQPVPTTS
jgi:DNA-binding GntR family transcriptional regulator